MESSYLAEVVSCVKQLNVVFGHQSVGDNILNGISQLELESGISLNRISTRVFDSVDQPVFLDFKVGKNGYGIEKIDDFVNYINSTSLPESSIVFFKLCYVDVRENSNVDELYEYYRDQMLLLKNQHPELYIALITIPLTIVQTGFRAIVKRIIGRPPAWYIDNINREKFNQRVRNELVEEFPIFDLASIESGQEGSRQSFKYQGGIFPSMMPALTYDGSHLNDYGSRIVAIQLLDFLNNLAHL